MNEVLRFDCVACSAQLTLPAALAGISGPCPRCGALITAPLLAIPLPAHQALGEIHPPPPSVEKDIPANVGNKPGLAASTDVTLPANIDPPTPVSTAQPSPKPARISTDSHTPDNAADVHFASFPSAPPRPSRHGLILFLMCLATAAGAFTAGFFLGRGQSHNTLTLHPVAPRIEPKNSPESELAPPIAAETLVPKTLPPVDLALPAPLGLPLEQSSPSVAEVEPADALAATPEEATLRAFLSSPDWASRNVYVMEPERVREAMAEHAANYGDGPIAFKSITLLQQSEKSRVFLVRTPNNPDGFPVVLTQSETSGWLVDWEGFSEFNSDVFRQYVEQDSTAARSFRLLVNKVDDKPDSAGILRYRLNTPMPGRERIARVEDGSTAASQLEEIFAAQAKKDPETYLELMKSSGLPMIVSIIKRPAPGGGLQLWIDRVIATGWSPIMAPKTDSP